MKKNSVQLMENLKKEYSQQIDQSGKYLGKVATVLSSLRKFDYRKKWLQDLDAARDVFFKQHHREPRFSELREAFAKKSTEKKRCPIYVEIPSTICTTVELKNAIKDIYALLGPRLQHSRFREEELKRYLWVFKNKKGNIRYVDILDEYRQKFGFLNNSENDVISKMSLDLKRAKKIIRNIENNVPAWWSG